MNGNETMKYWSSYFLNVIVLAIDVPLFIKVILSIAAGLLTVVSLLNQVIIMIQNLPKWKAYWVLKLKLNRKQTKKFLKDKSGGTL